MYIYEEAVFPLRIKGRETDTRLGSLGIGFLSYTFSFFISKSHLFVVCGGIGSQVSIIVVSIQYNYNTWETTPHYFSREMKTLEEGFLRIRVKLVFVCSV